MPSPCHRTMMLSLLSLVVWRALVHVCALDHCSYIFLSSDLQASIAATPCDQFSSHLCMHLCMFVHPAACTRTCQQVQASTDRNTAIYTNGASARTSTSPTSRTASELSERVLYAKASAHWQVQYSIVTLVVKCLQYAGWTHKVNQNGRSMRFAV